MERPTGFRTGIVSSVMHGLDAKDRAVLNATLREIDQDMLPEETLTRYDGTDIVRWDVCFVSVFDEGVYIKHWTRPLRTTPVPQDNIHAALRRLSGPPRSRAQARDDSEKVRAIASRSVTGTIAFLAIGRTEAGDRIEQLWRHPSLEAAQALRILHGFVHYALEEDDGG